jgi:uncharacterized repeat protein (TIGR01451 family)
MPFASVDASGSAVLNQASNGGYRAYLEWRDDLQIGGIDRKGTIYAFVFAGETIAIGSSAMGVGNGDVLVTPPGGTQFSCDSRGGASTTYGRIFNITQENAGPLPNTGGYEPCIVSTTETTAAGDGLWSFEFRSPLSGGYSNANDHPPPLRVGLPWTQNTAGPWTTAWDITVRNSTGATENGRAFAYYLPLNMGNNASSVTPIALNARFYVLTVDGYGYNVDLNGIDPFGTILFSNTEGLTDSSGRPIYRSLQLVRTNPGSLPTGFDFHPPTEPDNIAQRDFTNKIFFEEPDPDLPLNARLPGTPPVGSPTETWLFVDPPIPPADPQNFSFTQTGAPNPLSGSFSFDVTEERSFVITVDANSDGVFGNANDRVLLGLSTIGANTIAWDGLDANGVAVQPSDTGYNVSLEIYGGEAHFTFLDPENNRNGFKIQRVRDPNTTIQELDPFTIFYDHSYNYRPGGTFDFSPCAAGQTAPSPAPTAPDNILNPICYGIAPVPVEALQGVASTNGASAWTNNYGDRRALDTWVYYPSNATLLITPVGQTDADLALTKTSSNTEVTPGGPINFNIAVVNNGPDDVTGAPVFDNVPDSIVNVSWSCTVSGGGACGAPSGSGNVISTTVDLDNGATATYLINGTLRADATGEIVNSATVSRKGRERDRDPNNNSSTVRVPVRPVADLELTKTIVTPDPVANQPVTFLIDLVNRGPSEATGVAVRDELPAGLAFVSASPSRGTYDSTSGIWTIGTLARDERVTLQITATWNGATVTNIAQVSASDTEDVDSTPNNDIPTEDDQDSATLQQQLADLRLQKVVSRPTVPVGGSAIYTITLTNDGPATATNVVVSDRLPVGLQYVSSTPSQGTYNPALGDWTVGTLAVNQSATLAIEVTLLDIGPFVNIAQVSASDQEDPDSTPNNDNPNEDDQSSATVNGEQADLAISKRASLAQPILGQTLVYTVEVRNDGPSTANDIEVVDRLPTGLTFVSATTSQGTYDDATGVWTVGTLTNGARASLIVTATVTQRGLLENEAEVTKSDKPDPDSRPGNGVPSEDDFARVRLPATIIDLQLQKEILGLGPDAPAIGDVLTYQITVDNVSNPAANATGVQVTDRLPQGLVFSAARPERGTYNPLTGAWEIGDILAGESVSLQIDAVIRSAGSIVNGAEISKADQLDIDSTPNNGIGRGEDDEDSTTVTVPTAVTLSRFSAVRQGGEVVVSWETGTELESAGFHLYRSADGQRSSAERVTERLIAAQGQGGAGASYSWRDSNVVAGVTYSYWLVEVTLEGTNNEYGPVSTAAGTAAESFIYLPLIR